MAELGAYLFLVGLITASVLTPVAIRLGHRWNILDTPGPRKIHVSPIPLTGGWAIFGALSLSLWVHLLGALVARESVFQDWLPDEARFLVLLTPNLIHKILPMYLGALLIFVLGVVDDLRGMSVKSRLVFQLLIAGVLVCFGLRPDLGFLPKWLAGVVGILWIVGITNAFNFLDGLDGLSTGVGLVATAALGTIMGMSNQPNVTFFMTVLAGVLLGFLRWNFHPAKVFLGSSGSLLIGYLLSILTLLITYSDRSSENWLMPLLTPVFVLAIPIYDSCSVILIRLVQKRNIAIGDQSHFHHRLMKLGFSHRQTVGFIILIAISVGLSGVRLTHATIAQSLLILAQIAGIMSLLVIAERVAAAERVRNLKETNQQESLTPGNQRMGEPEVRSTASQPEINRDAASPTGKPPA